MTNKEWAAWCRARLNKPAACRYNNKARSGQIIGVRQGPCFTRNSGGVFEFAGDPNGDVYIKWRTLDGKIKTFKFERIERDSLVFSDSPAISQVSEDAAMKAVENTAVEPQSETVITVRRMRPTLG